MPLTGAMAVAVATMAALLDVRSAFRLSIVFTGAMLAGGRRTASCWFRAAGVREDWDCFYDLLPAIGKKSGSLDAVLLRVVVQQFDPGRDSYRRSRSTTRGSNDLVHMSRPPMPITIPHRGPAVGPWLYGYYWDFLARLMNHPLFGVIALPVLSSLYVRSVDIPTFNE